jgi:hypothetical protein
LRKNKEDYYLILILLPPENNKKVAYTILQYKTLKQIKSTKDKSRPSIIEKKTYQIYFKLDSFIDLGSLQ